MGASPTQPAACGHIKESETTMVAMPSRYSGILITLLVLITPAASSIPRSSSSSLDATAAAAARRPPWNLSSQINKQGYLRQLFRRIPAAASDDVGEYANANNYKDKSLVPVVIRQVPGDGDCLFHAIAISLAFTENGHLMRLDTHDGLQELKAASRKLRRMAVECLVSSCSSKRQNNNNNHNHKSKRSSRRYKRLFIQGKDSMKTSQLLYTASSQYGITPEEYCELMMQDSYWGGGPEIVALCAVLRRPIHVYELVPLPIDGNGNISDDDENRHDEEYDEKAASPLANKDRINNKFCLRLLATFGSPKYDSNDALHILSADSRFPDIDEPHCALKEGNHFLAMFPVDRMILCLCNYYANGLDDDDSGGRKEVSDRKQLVRGGDAGNISTADNKMLVVEAESDDHLVGLPWLFHGEWYDDLPCDTRSPCQNEELVNDKKGWKCSTWFRLRRNNRHPKGKKKDHKEDNEVISKSSPNSMTRFVGYWINVFVRILAFCGDMA